ncbi:MAG: gephyrin-like molybdotransferase Glp [Bacteroidales bacterium]
MIKLEQSISTVLEFTQEQLCKELVPLWESTNRVLAVDVFSDINMPPFNKAAVDGYACRKADIFDALKVVEVIPAGQFPQKTVEQGTCSKIMTGAPVPQGADCILMVEETEIVSKDTIRFTGDDTKTNIALFAEDVKQGDLVLNGGTLIEPQHVAILAAVGVSQVEVAVQPKVAVLTTGDELVEPDIVPHAGQIRNSNGHQLYTQVKRAGALPIYGGIIDDTLEATRDAISKALSECDIVILTGGVSMGDFDYVPQVLSELGVELKFKTIAVQPGKPTVFGVKESKLVFGLPGNPVSSFLQFELHVRPAIQKIMGSRLPQKNIIKIPLAVDYKRKRAGRQALVPAQITDSGQVQPVSYHGSAHIFALSAVNAFISVPIGVESIQKGELVNVRPL